MKVTFILTKAKVNMWLIIPSIIIGINECEGCHKKMFTAGIHVCDYMFLVSIHSEEITEES